MTVMTNSRMSCACVCVFLINMLVSWVAMATFKQSCHGYLISNCVMRPNYVVAKGAHGLKTSTVRTLSMKLYVYTPILKS